MSAAVDEEESSSRASDLFAGRYLLGHSLKSGNGVETLVATDSVTAASVVLKVIDPAFVHPAARMRFQHETQVLRELAGLGLSGLHDAGSAGDRLYLAQPLLPGRTLELVLRDGPIDLVDTLRIGIDVASALDAAHSAGICHRDVKPANIITDAVNPVGTATLVDFGFARSQWLDESIRDDLVGTVRYLAPESAGSLATPPDERSDLYAIGVVLFECLAGGPPFPGPTVGDLLRQHLSMPVPELRSRGVNVPRSVDDLVQRLLRKDPAERYQSAAALAADLTALLHAVESGDPDPRLVIGRLDQRSSLTDPSFVGRYAEVDSLSSFVVKMSAGSSGLVLVDADSGGGKSRLLSEVALRAVDAGVTVLHGQGVVQAGQRPFTLLLGVVDGLIAMLDPDEEAKQALRRELQDVTPALVRAIPALSALLGETDDKDSGPEQFGELRSLGGLRRLLSALPTPNRPILLVLDDCQWADTLTVRLLAELFPRDEPPSFLGVIAAFRSEEVPTDHPLRRIPDAQSLSLGPLSQDAMASLAESMAGPLPEQVVDLVVRLADGNPFMGAAVLRGLVESGALFPTGDGWDVDDHALQDVQAARRSAAFLVRRLELLDSDALALLSVGAVLGKQFDIVTAVAIAGMADGAASVIADARRRRLLWVDERTGHCSFFHDKIREALLDRLTSSGRRQLHSRAADELIARGGSVDNESVFDLAYHLDAADRNVEALPYALASAELSRTRYALDAAVSHYRTAMHGLSPDDDVTTIRIAEGLGDVLTLQGVYGEAETNLAQARALVDDRSHAAALEGKLGALAFKQGDIATAKRHLEGALIGLGRRIPRRQPALSIALTWELLVQTMHTLVPWLFVGRRKAAGHEDDFLAMRLYSRLTYLYWFHSGKVPCAWSHLRGLNLAERYEPSAELGQAYSEHAPVMTMLPWFGRGLRYGMRSFEIRRDLGDVWGQGQSLSFIAVVRYGASQWPAASGTCHEAVRLLRQTGDQWEVNTASWHDALCHVRMGNLAQAADTARQVYHSAHSIGDRASTGIALSVWTRAVGGRVDLRLITDALADGDDDAHTAAELHFAAALHHRAHGNLDAAWASLDEAATVVRNAGLRHDYITPVFTWRVTVGRELAEATPALNPDLRRQRLRSCAHDARRARRLARSYRNNLPHALREAGLVASLRGRRRAAIRLIDRSVALAERQGAMYELAQSHLARAEVDAACGGPQDAVDMARAEVALIETGTPDAARDAGGEPTISLFDRFSALLNVGRAITAATSYGALENAIREAAMTLLRAERCHLVSVGQLSQEHLTTQSGENLVGMSRSLLTRAVDEGGPVVSLEQVGEANESLVLAGIRSALAAPIVVDGKVTTCIYATHRQIGRLFGDEEIQLAAFIATLAGAAFEHLAGSETRFRSLAQNSSDVITLVDRDGIVSYQSSAVSRVFALPPASMLGRPVSDWVHPDDLSRFSAVLASAGKADDTRIECRFRHADGSFRAAETTVTNLLAEPTVAALVLNTRDVTDRRRAEEQLREKNVELEKAGRAKDMFLASMSHELRTPLNAIIGFTGTLLMELPGPLNVEQGRQLRTVQNSGKHLLSIINDLLDLAKIESGAVELKLEDVDCGQVVQTVMTALQPLADAKGLRLSAAVPDEPLMVRSDARALGQILINLVNNAIKFTDAGTVSVQVDSSESAPRIIVSDTGTGVSQADLDRIFKAFERGVDASAQHREGTGLGLHICSKLAELIDAHITVDTAPNAGSTFAVVFREAA